MLISAMVVTQGVKFRPEGGLNLLGVEQKMYLDSFPAQSKPIAVAVFATVAGDQAQKIRVRFAVLDPDDSELGASTQEVVWEVPARGANTIPIEFGYMIPPFPVARPGVYTLACYVNGDYQNDVALYVYAGPRPDPHYDVKKVPPMTSGLEA